MVKKDKKELAGIPSENLPEVLKKCYAGFSDNPHGILIKAKRKIQYFTRRYEGIFEMGEGVGIINISLVFDVISCEFVVILNELEDYDLLVIGTKGAAERVARKIADNYDVELNDITGMIEEFMKEIKEGKKE